MSIVIEIRKNETGEIREYIDKYHDQWWTPPGGSDHDAEFMWTEGNFGCDCNRELMFENDKNPDFNAVHCSEGRFSVRPKGTEEWFPK